MKMMYGNVPIKSLKVKHYEVDTNSATMIASDLQSGVTAFAKGKKVTGTGKTFEFAQYGRLNTNSTLFSPAIINVIEIASLDYPIRTTIALSAMRNIDFSIEQIIGYVVIDNVEYSITAKANGIILTLACEKTIELQVFYGKDRYV